MLEEHLNEDREAGQRIGRRIPLDKKSHSIKLPFNRKNSLLMEPFTLQSLSLFPNLAKSYEMIKIFERHRRARGSI